MRQDLQETRRQGTHIRPLKIYQMNNQTAKIDVPYHWQDGVEILWIQCGRLSLRINEKEYICKKGDIFYINPRELHEMKAETADCLYFAFVFFMSWLRFGQADEANEKYLKPLIEQNAYITTYLSYQTVKLAVPLLQEIIECYNNNENGAWLGIKANFLKFYYYIYQNNMVILKRKENSKQTELLLEISSYIQTHCGEKLSLEKLGNEFHMSPKYFSAYFQKHFSRNFTYYLTTIRIEHAKKLLVETEKNIELIAQQSGFSESSYFIRIFRKTQGLTPGQYRRYFEDISLPEQHKYRYQDYIE